MGEIMGDIAWFLFRIAGRLIVPVGLIFAHWTGQFEPMTTRDHVYLGAIESLLLWICISPLFPPRWRSGRVDHPLEPRSSRVLAFLALTIGIVALALGGPESRDGRITGLLLLSFGGAATLLALGAFFDPRVVSAVVIGPTDVPRRARRVGYALLAMGTVIGLLLFVLLKTPHL